MFIIVLQVFTYSFTYSFNKHLLTSCYESFTLMGVGDSAMTKLSPTTVSTTLLKVQWLSRELTFLPSLAYSLASLFLKFRTFTKISRCLLFSHFLFSLAECIFDLLAEAVLQRGEVLLIISACSVASHSNSCSAFLLPSSYVHLPGMPGREWCPQEFANGNFLLPS